jgi:hypothetical protein
MVTFEEIINSAFDASQQFRGRDLKRFRQLKDCFQRRTFLPSLKEADICSVVTTLKAELFLGKAVLLTDFLKNLAEFFLSGQGRLSFRGVFLNLKLDVIYLHTKNLQTIVFIGKAF